MINVAMWGRALKIIPRLGREEWDALDIVSRWLIATRAAVFIMTAISCAIGGLLAFRDGLFAWQPFVACMIGLIFAHATNNLLNDLTDHIKGVDKDNYFRSQYGPQPLEHGLMSKRQLWVYILVSGFVAAAMGVYLVATTGIPTLVLMGAGAFFVLFYTWPLKYIGLGEPAVVLVWGPLMVGGTYLVVSGGQWSWIVALLSLAYAIGPTTVLFGKHTDKLELDKKKGIRTLPVILGERAARLSVIGMWAVQYILIVALVVTGMLGPAMLIVLVELYDFYRVSKVFMQPRPVDKPDNFPAEGWPLYLSAFAFVYNRRVGFLFVLGLVSDVLLTRYRIY